MPDAASVAAKPTTATAATITTQEIPLDLVALKAELDADPLGRGYAAMSDVEAADSLNVRDRQPDVESVDSQTLMGALDEAEYNNLAARGKAYWQLLIQAGGTLNTQIVRQQLAALFPNPSNTRTNLLALLKRSGSRAEELGLGSVTPSHIADARRL